MTYLELINKVMVGLREDTVLGLSPPYAKVIGQFVNEAKEEIEDLGPWIALRTTVTTATAAATRTVSLTSVTNERSYVLHEMDGGCAQCWITTAGKEARLAEVSSEVMEDLYNRDASQVDAQPMAFSYSMSSSGMTLSFWPRPDAIYTVKLRLVVPQAELTAATDALTINASPVWKLALAKAMDERGSEMAGSSDAAWGKAKRALDDYMMRDFGREPHSVREI